MRDKHLASIKLAALALLFFLSFSLVLVADRIKETGRVRPIAEAGRPKLFFSSDPASLEAGDNFNLSIKVNPNDASFHAFELYFTYDPEKIEIPSVPLASAISSQFTLLSKTIDSQTNTITIIGIRAGTAFSGSTDQEIATVSLRVKDGAADSAVFTWKEETKLGDNLQIEKINGSFPIGRATGAKLYFASAVGHGPYKPGEPLNLDVLLDTNEAEVKAVDVVFFYDDARLTFQNPADLEANIDFVEDGFDTNFAVKGIDPVNKKISIGLRAKSSDEGPIPVSGNNKHLATVRFRIKDDASSGELNFVADNTSNVYDLATQNILRQRPTHTVTVEGEAATPTPGSCDRKTEGDANCDGAVDLIDYSFWLNSQCGRPGPEQICSDTRADFDGDGDVDDDDKRIWFDNRDPYEG